MHITSLPSPYGIGALGRQAYDFADFLSRAGQTCWQVLPLGHTGFGDSPYQVFSMYAGNPYFIDLDLLIDDGLLNREDVAGLDWGRDPARADYGALYKNRKRTLLLAYARGASRYSRETQSFLRENSFWLYEYALFMALKDHFHMRPWLEWPDEDIRMHRRAAIEAYTRQLQTGIDFYVFVQFLFARQWERFQAYVHGRNIRLIGDLPMYVALDSVEVWARSAFFRLDANHTPLAVAGVPPDYFSANGQLWGNPLYDWSALKETGYALWMERLSLAARQYDIVRIDHFRGFESYWSVPYGQPTALGGKWEKGPAMDFIKTLRAELPHARIIVEDLGDLNQDARDFVKQTGYPGMKALQFAFEAGANSVYLPHFYDRHCVCYTGTHDNTSMLGWAGALSPADAQFAMAYLGLCDGPRNTSADPAENTGNDRGIDGDTQAAIAWGVIRCGAASVADLFIAQMQDYLALPGSCRMNTPGVTGGNWQWRMLPGAANDALADRIAALTALYNR
jgi:4-alpha-glucanotransferase